MRKSLISRSVDIKQAAKLIHHAKFDRSTWEQHDNLEILDGDASGRQLWTQFEDVVLADTEAATSDGVGQFKFRLANRAWLEDKVILSSQHSAGLPRE
ncbi:hypothetical protein MUCCIDRAFT_112183 [Mucor lusitanicus CBS 277.49]|uniref:Uncharacterized protein n=1 Tax=Mucor lusitanicus CBS 277.49 TaxID=747725 RepID=A0A168J5D9_MUCCL|nr:hypothetical protein MUCCIDRAFT_112183 [Mucor lusitanicus CBS 277.49]